VSPISGVVVFAALWAALDYLASLGSPGAALSPGYSQLDFPWNAQIASLFGVAAITCVLGLFAASAAMFAATRQKQFAVLAVAVFALNAGYGVWRMATAPQTQVVHVGLAADDSLIADGVRNTEAAALTVVKAYADAAQSLALKGANLIVFPEKIAVLSPAWRGAVNAELITAAHVGHATIVAGFDERDGSRRNKALVYFANGATPATYTKRKLVPGLESAFTPGRSSFMLGDRTAISICKDMDSPQMIRGDSVVGPDLFAVPAWDFDRDAVWHARVAIMRGVENGFAVVRSANEGLLTVSDAYGRVWSIRRSNKGGMVVLNGDVARGPGRTVYTGIGDAFSWVAGALALLLLGVAFLAGYRKDSPVV
jgi:apolipoprotein N-acyltransferase